MKNVNMCDYNDYIVTEEEVAKAVGHLKNGKADGDKGMMSDHVIIGPRRLWTLLSLLLTACRKHGYMPDEMLLATVASIPKDKCGDICDSDNYRGISLSSCLSKIHDIIVLNKHRKVLATSDMQYAFKEEHSTTMCTLTLKEVAKYYQQNNSDVFIGLVDASKAFDRVRHDRLFKLLIDRGLPAVEIRILLDSYRRQKLRTVWNGTVSECFQTTNGIKQGSIISPVLFTVYMDELLSRLENSGFGVRIGQHYYGAISYADDLSLVSPTMHGLQRMIELCEIFGAEYGVKYNPTKSVAMHVTKKTQMNLPPLTVAGDDIKWVTVAKHLGNYISADLREVEDVTHKRGDFIGRVNNVIVTFYGARDEIKREVFNSQCSHLYGCESWDLTDPWVDKFRTTWNRGVCRIINLPYDTHTRFLSLFINRPYVMDQIFKRFYKMVLRMMNSRNERLKYLINRMLQDSNSIVGRNCQLICNRYGLNYFNRGHGFNLNKFKCAINEEDERTVYMIHELREALRGNVINGLSQDQNSDIIHYLCSA